MNTPPQTAPSPGQDGAAHRPLLRLFPVLLLNLTAFGVAIPILPALVESYGGGGVEVGLLFTLQALGQFVMAPRWGRLSDRLGRKPVLLMTLLGAVCIDVATSLSAGLWMLYLVRLVGGLLAGNVATASAYVADATSLKDRSKGMALIGIGFGLGFTLGPGLGALVSHLAPDEPGALGMGAPFLFAALLDLLSLLLGAWLLREPSESRAERREAREEGRGVGQSFSELLARPGVKRMARFQLGYALAVTILETSFYLYASRQYGYDERQVGMIFGAMGLLAAAVQGRVGKISARLGDEKMTWVGALLLGVGLLVATAWEQIAFLLVWLGVAAVGRALVQPGAMALMSKLSRGEHESGALMGVTQSANSAGRIIGPLLGGVLFDYVAGRAPFIGAGSLVVLSALWWRQSGAAQGEEVQGKV